MTSDVANLTLEYLKRFDAPMERIENDTRDVKFRLGQIERQMVGVHDTLVHHGERFDRLEERLGRIAKRLDLVEV